MLTMPHAGGNSEDADFSNSSDSDGSDDETVPVLSRSSEVSASAAHTDRYPSISRSCLENRTVSSESDLTDSTTFEPPPSIWRVPRMSKLVLISLALNDFASDMSFGVMAPFFPDEVGTVPCFSSFTQFAGFFDTAVMP